VSPPDDEKGPEFFFLPRAFAVLPVLGPFSITSIFFILGGDGGDREVTTLSWTVFLRNHRGGDRVVTGW